MGNAYASVSTDSNVVMLFPYLLFATLSAGAFAQDASPETESTPTRTILDASSTIAVVESSISTRVEGLSSAIDGCRQTSLRQTRKPQAPFPPSSTVSPVRSLDSPAPHLQS